MMSNVKHLRIQNDSIVSNGAKLTVEGSNAIIPFYEANISLKAGDVALITLTAPIEFIDVIADAFDSNIMVVDQSEIDIEVPESTGGD